MLSVSAEGGSSECNDDSIRHQLLVATVIGWWRRDEVGFLSVNTGAGAVITNASLVHPASTVLAMIQQVERRAWLAMLMISSTVLNNEGEE
eukprot:scaffold114308_cov63-Attheya_sp.AAC.1